MNIDTLNAYCGNELVSFPYLAQGRLRHPSDCVCAQAALGSRYRLSGRNGASKYTVRSFATTQLLDLTVWVGLFAGCTCMVPGFRPTRTTQLIFDLRLGKITRRI